MVALRTPIVGDVKYHEPDQNGAFSALVEGLSDKLHLHARSISFDHPITKKRITLTAPLPDHMARTWKTLGWHENDVPDDPFADDE